MKISKSMIAEGFAAVLAFASSPAKASGWGTVSLKDRCGNTLGAGYGSACKGTHDGGDALKVFSTQGDRRINGNPIYTNAQCYFIGAFCYPAGESAMGRSSDWCGSGSTSSPTTAQHQSAYLAKSLPRTANSARAGIMVCAKQPWWDPGDCTRQTYSGISYWPPIDPSC